MDDLDLKVAKAVHRIEELYFQTNGACYVSFSGGKDSTIILALIKLSIDALVLREDSIKAVFSDTGVEMGATRDFVKWCRDSGWYPNIEIIKPEHSFSWILDNKGKPMKSKLKSDFINRYKNNIGNKQTMINYLIYGTNADGTKKYAKTKIGDKDLHILHDNFDIKVANSCCKILKKEPMKKYAETHDIDGYITGIRTGEGGARELNAKNRLTTGGKLCTATNGKYIVKMPIIDWTDDDVDEFIKRYNVPLSKAYTEYGLKRTGCMGCPFALDLETNLEALYKFEPNRYKACMHWLKDVYIAQDIKLPFDEEYEKERIEKWDTTYHDMRYEMLKKYRPDGRLCKKYEKEGVQVELL